MSRIVLHPTETAHWHSLVCEAEQAARHFLDEELQSYLVFLLMRFLGKPQIASSIVALEYIKGMRETGQCQHDTLRTVGDTCLLHAGFFPERAKRRRVSTTYYMELGCGAYLRLADAIDHGLSTVYGRLSEEFATIMTILQAMRELGGDTIPEQFHALQQWQTSIDGPLPGREFSDPMHRNNIN